MGRFVAGADRGQTTLFPECLDDWVDEDNPVQVVDAFVDAADLGELGFDGVVPEATGRPAYHPSCSSSTFTATSTASSRAPEPALGRRRIYIPRGKVLGGSSSLNFMVYIAAGAVKRQQFKRSLFRSDRYVPSSMVVEQKALASRSRRGPSLSSGSSAFSSASSRCRSQSGSWPCNP